MVRNASATSAWVKLPDGAGHVDQAVLLVGVAEDAGDLLGDQELLELPAELHVPGEVAHPPPHLAVQVGLGVLGRGLDGDLGEQDPGPLELPLVGAELVGGLGLDVDHRPAPRAPGRRAPAGRFEEDALLDRDDDPALGLAAGPGPLDHPRLDDGRWPARTAGTCRGSSGWPCSGPASRSAAARSCRRDTRCWPSAPSACRSLPGSPG